MKFQHSTILITGGSSGIGFQLAKTLTEKNNQVIICGRSATKLEKAKKLIPALQIFQCDLSQKTDCEGLAQWISEKHPQCNILINNAALVHRTNFFKDDDMVEKAGVEIRTNLMAPITLTKLFLPIIEKNPHPKIINVTSGLAYVPKASYPIYNATKAALHSFTQTLRLQKNGAPTSVIEVMFPAVDTPWHEGNPPTFAISPEKAVDEMITKLEKGQTEIQIGKVKLLYILSRLAPSLAIKKINEAR